MNTINKVAIYVRVSTTSQAEEGYSVEEQISKLKSYCEIKDWSVFDIYTDGGFTGSNIERPELNRLIMDAKFKRFDTVLVYKLDRLSRSQKDTLYLIEEIFNKNDIGFLSLLENFDTSTPFGKAMVGILSVFAQLEREQIKERMQLGKLGRAKSGKSMMWAKVSYGYTYHRDTGELTINESEAIVVRIIFSEYLSGRSIINLRNYLSKNNLTKGKPWGASSIRAILENPIYCGYGRYKGELYKGNHKPIISEEDFQKVQDEIKIRQISNAKLKNNPRPFRSKYLLSGIIKCGFCESILQIAMNRPRKDGTRAIRYRCPKCNPGNYNKETVENYVLNEISKLQDNKIYLNSILNAPKKMIDRKSIEAEIDNLNKKLRRLNDLYLNGHIALDELKQKSNQFINQKNILEQELTNDQTPKIIEAQQRFREVLKCGKIMELGYEEQTIIAKKLIKNIFIKNGTIEIEWML